MPGRFWPLVAVKNAYWKFWKAISKSVSNAQQKNYWKFKNRTDGFSPEKYLKEKTEYDEIWNKLTDKLNLKNKVVYDYGCGAGKWSVLLKKKGARVIGVDYARSELQHSDEFVKADITRFRGKKADLINCVRVLIHLSHAEQQKAIELIRENLKDRGYLIAVEKNTGTSPRQWGRHWRETAEFYGFEVVKFISNGVVEGVLGRKR